MVLIIYTTSYRNGSDMFKRVAETMYNEITLRYNGEIVCLGIISKKNLTELFNKLKDQQKLIDEYHFIGHSGIYGPMFGTVEYPEQYSPYELKNLEICTHYPAIAHKIKQFTPKATLLNPVSEMSNWIINHWPLSQGNSFVRWVTTGDIEQMKIASYNAFKVEINNVEKISL